MSLPYEDGTPPSKDKYKWLRITLIALVGLLFVVIVLPSLLRAFALGLKGEFDSEEMKNKVDIRTCEFVLNRERSESFLKCPLPENVRVPNWPDKKAPLNSKSPTPTR